MKYTVWKEDNTWVASVDDLEKYKYLSGIGNTAAIAVAELELVIASIELDERRVER